MVLASDIPVAHTPEGGWSELGVHVLRPVGAAGAEVTRKRDGDDMIWSYAGAFVARLRRRDDG